jgi:hypothetical protein
MGGIHQARRVQPHRLADFETTPQATAQETGEHGEQVRPALSNPDLYPKAATASREAGEGKARGFPSRLDALKSHHNEAEYTDAVQIRSRALPVLPQRRESIVRCEGNRDGSGSNASSKMRVGPSESADRSGLQITSSCVGQESAW